MGNGEFQELSGVTGLDFREDGRAYAVVDFDQDGDLDLVVKFRNAPQLRLLRNDTPTDNHSIAFELVGGADDSSGPFRSSRDAVGALVEIETPRGKQTQQVTLGSGFLSQSPRSVPFGLGDWGGPVRATIVWPSGGRQTLENLPADHRIRVKEGQPNWRAVAFQERNPDLSGCAPQPVPDPGVRPEGYAFLQPVPTPSFALPTLAGETVTRESLEGRPVLVNFWATWCAPCQEEMRLWKEHYAEIRQAGAELVAISVDVPEDAAQVERFVQERQLPFPVLRMDAETLERYNVFYRRLFERRSDLQIPTTFLLNSKGELVKLYRGVVPVNTLMTDLRAVNRSPAQLAQTGLPYAGRRFVGSFGRDYYHLGVAFFDRGLLDDAGFYLREAVERNPADAESWNNLGVVYAAQGRLEEARQALEQSVRADPDYADGYFNLGIAYLRLNQPIQAEEAFRRAAELDPLDPQKLLQYATILATNGKLDTAIPVLELYLKLEPGDARAHSDLGAFLAQTGALAQAREEFRRATQLDPQLADAYRNLGILYLEQEMPFRAAEALERAVELSPEDADAHFALADAYLRLGRAEEAERMLERVLQLKPNHPQARPLLERLRRPPTH
ncbi:tetratricopeptide repeat protein [Acidobacteriia bacterium AH_259_A11_L15]|nr:tetratricopeptide repeat protein [Acidobacteriia bacterium AH_259_A11_L15]